MNSNILLTEEANRIFKSWNGSADIKIKKLDIGRI